MLIPVVSQATYGQGSRDDYLRAQNLRERTRDKVFRDRIRAHWLPDNRRFWYRVATAPDCHEFVLVDAVRRSREPAFDHERLAAALRKLGKEVEAANLPISDLQWDEDHALVFRLDGDWFRCDLEGYALEPAEPRRSDVTGMHPEDGPRASRRTGEETEILFVNGTNDEVEIFWLDADGRRRSYGRIGPGKQHRQHTYEGHVWLVVQGDDKPLAVFVADREPLVAEINGVAPRGQASRRRSMRPNRSQAVSPDGKWEATIRDHNVWLRDTSTDEATALTSDGTDEDAYQGRFYWSPDGKKLAVVRRRRAQEHKVYLIESSPDDQLQPKLHSFDYLKPGDRIAHDRPCLFDIPTRKAIPVGDDLFPNPWSLTRLQWTADSKELIFLYNQRGHQLLRLIALDGETGEARVVIEEKSDTFIDYANKLFLSFLDDGNEVIWMSERDGWNHLYLYDAAEATVKNQITRGPWVVRSVEHVDPEQRQIWFRAGGIHPDQDPYFVHYGRVNFDGTGLVVLTDGNGTHEVEFSPDRRYLVDRWSRVDQPPVTELRRADNGQKICDLEHADWSRLIASGWRPPERFVAKGRDGQTDIYGVIFRPMGHDPDNRYPVIESIYAGPHGAFVPKSFRAYYKEQSFCELGFIVVKIDGMGTSHRSKRFHDVCWKNLADSGFPDRILWIRAAAQHDPSMDLTRVGIYGGSAGGQSALRALLDHGDFYRVAVADCGCHDNRMDKIWWNELWMGWPVGPHYEDQSNVTDAHLLQGKLLLIVGELDRNVDPASTMQVVDALIKADKDFDLLVIPGTGHGAAETAYGTRRRYDFFVRHLLGVEPRHD